jgi:hypothetical protein
MLVFDNITASLRQPFEQLTTALTADLREAVAMYFPGAKQPQSLAPAPEALLHSAVSDRAAGIGGLTLTADIKDYYLGTPMERPEYVRIQRGSCLQAL